MSQAQQILDHLRAGNKITPLEALHRFGCLRLGARIYDLRRDGHAIEAENIAVNGKWVARYRMARDW